MDLRSYFNSLTLDILRESAKRQNWPTEGNKEQLVEMHTNAMAVRQVPEQQQRLEDSSTARSVPAPTIPNFHGGPQEASAWLQQVSRARQNTGISDLQFLQQIQNTVGPLVKAWLQVQNFKSYEEFEKQFKSTFIVFSKSKVWDQLAKIRWQDHTTLFQFVQTILETFQTYGPDISTADRIDYIREVTPPQFQIMLTGNTEIKEIHQLLPVIQQFDRMHAQRQESSPSRQQEERRDRASNARAYRPWREDTRRRCFRCGEAGHLRRECPRLGSRTYPKNGY